MTHQISEELCNSLLKLVEEREEPEGDEEDYSNPYDDSDGNFDDYYQNGIYKGEFYMAEMVLADIVKQQLKGTK
jgi:hypothetical protein